MTALLPTPAPETAPETAPSLAVRQLNHAWAARSVLEDIGFTLPAGRAIALVGPCGPLKIQDSPSPKAPEAALFALANRRL